MKVLVVSYSHTGTCRRVRQALSARSSWAEGEVVDLRRGRGNWRCVLDSLLRRSPAIQYNGPAPEDFDVVVLIAPIWANRLAGPMRTFVRVYRKQLRAPVALVSVMGGSGGLNALAEVTELLGRAPAMFATVTSLEVDTGAFAHRLQELHDSIVSAAAPRTTTRPQQPDDAVLSRAAS